MNFGSPSFGFPADFDSKECAIAEEAMSLYGTIGADLLSACGLGTEDAYPEDEEVVCVLQDRLRDWLAENAAHLVPTWDTLTPQRKEQICAMAL